MNKKAMSVFPLFYFVFIFFFAALMLGIALFIFLQVNSVLSLDVDVGQVNLATVNSQSYGKMALAFLDRADTIGMIILLGMVFSMFINAYYLGSNYPKIMLIVDILLLLFIFITSVYLSTVYELFINSTSLLQEIYIDNIPKTSTFILNLPSIVSTIGVILMIITYSGIKKDGKQDKPVLGYYN